MPLDDADTPAAAEPISHAGRAGPAWDATERSAGLPLTSAAMFVSDLDRSAAFYTELLAWSIAVRDLDAALPTSPDGFQLYLRRRGPRAAHDLGHIGVQYLIGTP
jgi:hypothetical protein